MAQDRLQELGQTTALVPGHGRVFEALTREGLDSSGSHPLYGVECQNFWLSFPWRPPPQAKVTRDPPEPALGPQACQNQASEAPANIPRAVSQLGETASQTHDPGLVLVPTPQKLGRPESLSRSYIRSGDTGSTIRKDQPHSCLRVSCCFSYLSSEAPGPPASVPYPRALLWASGSWGHSSRWAGQQQEAACPHASDTHTPPSCRQPHRVHWAGGQARVQRVAREGCHQGTCQGSGTSAQGCPCCNITSGVFSCFIVKQQKHIYTPISLNI